MRDSENAHLCVQINEKDGIGKTGKQCPTYLQLGQEVTETGERSWASQNGTQRMLEFFKKPLRQARSLGSIPNSRLNQFFCGLRGKADQFHC